MKLFLLLSERVNLLLDEVTRISDTGSFLDLIIIRDLKEKLSIKQEEISIYKIDEDKNMIRWKEDGLTEYDFTEKEFDKLWEHINSLSIEKKLNEKLLRLASSINEIKSLTGV